MEWRCEWCGKPHEENDPPCDNCGHGKFEKAVVRQTDLAEEGDGSPALVWVCTECGREHPKNNPPCSRCGALDLDQRRQQIDQSELSAPSYLDLLTPQYLAAASVVFVLVVVFMLGVTGLADIPGFGNQGVPLVDDVPGNGTAAGSTSLAVVEDRFTDSLNSRIEAENQPQVQRNDDLDSVARYLNQKYVQSAYAGPGESRQETRLNDIEIPDSVRETAGNACSQGTAETYAPVIVTPDTAAQTQTADQLGDQLAERLLFRLDATELGGEQIGIDAHEGPDGAVLLLVVTC